MTIKIVKCNCKHAFQDATYGYGMRVANSCTGGYRCTVCLHIHKSSDSTKKK